MTYDMEIRSSDYLILLIRLFVDAEFQEDQEDFFSQRGKIEENGGPLAIKLNEDGASHTVNYLNMA